MPFVAIAIVIVALATLLYAVFATRRAETRMGGHPSVPLLYRAYGA